MNGENINPLCILAFGIVGALAGLLFIVLAALDIVGVYAAGARVILTLFCAYSVMGFCFRHLKEELCTHCYSRPRHDGSRLCVSCQEADVRSAQ